MIDTSLEISKYLIVAMWVISLSNIDMIGKFQSLKIQTLKEIAGKILMMLVEHVP